jgi:CheY-like chemotaxis protein
VDIADNGKDALEAIHKKQYDAVLMDIQMPEMDGFEATRRIRRDDRFAALPIIAMTAHAMKGDDKKCLTAGMDDYIAKPIKQDRLFRILWKAIERRTGTQAPLSQPAASLQMEAPSTSKAPAAVLPEALPGIDIRDALATLGIKPDAFRRILVGFARDNRDTLSRLKELVVQKDWKTLHHLAHRLNGIAANIGAKGLQSAAQILEVQCRAQAPEESTIHHIETALQQVLQSLQFLSTPLQNAVEDKPALLSDPQRLKPLLAQLAAALEMADPEAIESHLQAVGQHLDSTRFQTLANQIATYDYDNALQTIKEILGNFAG